MSVAESKVDELRKKGVNAICSFATDKKQLKTNKQSLGAKLAVFVGKDGEEEI